MEEQINLRGYLTTIDENLNHTTKFIKSNYFRRSKIRTREKHKIK